MQIFIGAENQLFGLSGCSMIVAPYSAGAEGGRGATVLGAIGVIGPTRMNYARIIPAGRLHRARGQSAPGHTGYRDETMSDTDNRTATDEAPRAARRRSRRRHRRRRRRPRSIQELKDRLLRTLAEMENLRARTQREVEEARKFAVTGFARDLLEVGDNLGRALASVPAEARAAERVHEQPGARAWR